MPGMWGGVSGHESGWGGGGCGMMEGPALIWLSNSSYPTADARDWASFLGRPVSVGPPKASKSLSVEQLTAMKFHGLYQFSAGMGA